MVIRRFAYARHPWSRVSTTPFAIHKCGLSTATGNPLPAYFIRGGTSKGIFLAERDLPRDQSAWKEVFRGIMGSPDPNGRQLNGMGGGLSSLSKIVIVKPSKLADVDLEYTFVQIGIKDGDIDLSGNCGNLSSAVAPYAISAGLLPPPTLANSGTTTLSLLNTNTNKRIRSTFSVTSAGQPLLSSPSSTFTLDGVSGTASKITMDYLNPGGARTGKLFPTGNKVDIVDGTRITCIDCTNPTVYVSASDLGLPATLLPDDFTPQTLETLETLRKAGARLMGLDPTAQSQPKIAMVGPPSTYTMLSGESMDAESVDLIVRAVSMQQPHRAVPMTLAMATAVAARIDGTIVSEVSGTRNPGEEEVRIGHPSGRVEVGAELSKGGEVVAAKVFRTARILMRGEVYW